MLLWPKDYKLLIFDKIDSTNDEALRLAKSRVNGNFVIIAKDQTKGRGTKGKSWESIIGNLHMSILLQSLVSIDRIKELSFLTAIVVREAILECIDKFKAPKVDIKLKWPNDVLIDGKKVSGILLESTNIQGINYAIIGVGVNTYFVPSTRSISATSLLSEGVVFKNPDSFLNIFMNQFQFHYFKWKKAGSFDSIRRWWLECAYKLNSSIIVDNGEEKIFGIFKGVDNQGGICVELINGELCSYSSGQVTYPDK